MVGDAVRIVADADLDDLKLDDSRSMGYTLKAMQIGLWSLVHGDDFSRTLVDIVSAGGDTDTNGAVAGAVLGGVFGVDAIPGQWLECVSDRERLDDLAGRLLTASHNRGQ